MPQLTPTNKDNLPRRKRSAPPLSLTKSWWHHSKTPIQNQNFKQLCSFLYEHGLLTKEGAREYEKHLPGAPPSLQSRHIKTYAGSFLDHLYSQSPDLSTCPNILSAWELYRNKYDFNKKVTATPWQKLLLRYTSSHEAVELYFNIRRFPHLLAQIEKAFPHAPPKEQKHIITLLYLLHNYPHYPNYTDFTDHRDVTKRDPALNMPPSIEDVLFALPFVIPYCGAKHHLTITAEILDIHFPQNPDSIVKLLALKAVNLPPIHRLESRSQASEQQLSLLSTTALDCLSNPEVLCQAIALSALRTVGNEQALEYLHNYTPPPCNIKIGPRPGTNILQALKENALRWINHLVEQPT